MEASGMRRLLPIAVLTIAASPVHADGGDLAKQLSNPVASLVSVPFQFNYDCCYGPDEGARATLNIQPVVPLKLSSDWTLILRTILPVIEQGEAAFDLAGRFGLGDASQSFFFSPNPAPGGWIWGAGPAFLWPTATESTLGSGKWGVGPTAVLLKQLSGWTFGVLTNHIWSYAGDGDRAAVSDTFIQPFVGFTWPDTTSLTVNTESTYDWTAGQWTVPINLTLGHIFRFDTQPVSFQFGVRYDAIAPEESASWGARFNIVLLFPQH
jgi:hypothetical protein